MTVGAELLRTELLVPSLQPEALPIRAISPAPCSRACPAGVNVKAYVSLIGEGRFAEALEVVRQRCPLPGICGRICHHPCEAACRRNAVDEPVAIRALKRFVADVERELPVPVPAPDRELPFRVAVVGSGPAGLTAAFDLRLAGFPVTIFEAEAEPGGMLRYGITPYRLPREILDGEIAALQAAGIEIRTGSRLGRDLALEELLGQGFGAVLLAVGAQVGRRLGLAGEETAPRVEDALAFLRRVNEGDRSRVDGRVLVIGGGSTAVEAARTARRLGADSVEIVYRRLRQEMPAGEEEIEAAEAEGIGLRFLTAPQRLVLSDGRLEAVECLRIGLGEPDASGRRRPLPIPGSEHRLPADLLLAAVGQAAELDFLPERIRDRVAERGLLSAAPETAMTALRGVFAAGDAVSGPSTVIEAIAAGHRAAESIRHFLEEGRPAIREQRPELWAPREYELPDAAPVEASRVRPFWRGPRPGREFAEVERCYTAAEAEAEARRCLRCGPCGECRICAPSCGRRHLALRLAGRDATVLLRAPGSLASSLPWGRATPVRLVPRHPGPGRPGEVATKGVSAELQPLRVRVAQDLCRACARCVEVCPFDAVGLREDVGPLPAAVVDPARCRGCALCVGVCPTGAARPGAFEAQGLGVAAPAARAPEEGAGPLVVLACQRRSGAVGKTLESHGVAVEIRRLRCVGGIDAGLLLETYRQGGGRILVAGCLSKRCRFGDGARRAAEEVARAQSLMRLAGIEGGIIVSDFSGDRVHDPLEAAMVAALAAIEPPQPKAAAVGS